MVGFVVHVVQISNNYFEYSATTILQMDIPTDLANPGLSVCWRYADLLDIDGLKMVDNRFEAVNFTNEKTILDSVRKINSMITVEQIFKFSPSSMSIMEDCSVRIPGQEVMKQMSSSGCRAMFEVKKFFIQEYVCYSSVMTVSGNYDYQKVGSSLNYPGTLYEIHFRLDLFKINQVLVPIVHRSDSLPTTSIYFAPRLHRFDTQEGSHPKNHFFLSYFSIQYNRLPTPYATKCSNYKIDQPDCNKQCKIRAMLRNHNSLPFTELIHEIETFPTNKRILSYDDFNNRTLVLNLAHIDQKFKLLCKNLDCKSEITMTRTKYIGEKVETIAFRVNIPNFPNYYVTYIPMMLFYEYVTYVLSALGVWFGMSIFDLNPFPLCSKYFSNQLQYDRDNRRLVSRVPGMKLEIDALKVQLALVLEKLETLHSRSRLNS